jgi:nickel-dependent lactate racemase
MHFRLPYAREYREINLPDNDEIKIIVPSYPEQTKSEEKLINTALLNPIEKPPLSELINKDDLVCILVDDITRPTPTQKLLSPILDTLEGDAVKKENVVIVVAQGTHRKMTEGELIELLGEEVMTEVKIVQHDEKEKRCLKPVRDPVSGREVFKVNKWVAEADLRILTGFISPHVFAGYTGGAKSILPGVSDEATIKKNHSYEMLSHPFSIVGEIEGNIIREDMEEKARFLEPNFILNTILDNKAEIIAVVAGDVVRAHREGVKIIDQMIRIEVKDKADVVLSACSFPEDIDLYQASFNAITVARVKKPIIKKGGVVILSAHCPEGLGDETFAALITKYKDPDTLLRVLSNPNFVYGQWTAQVWAEALTEVRVIMVSDGIPSIYFENNPVLHASSIEEAWQKAKKILNKDKVTAYILPEPYSIIPL